MAKKTIAPALADIRQDIAGPIPVDLILRWTTQEKSKTMHEKLLAPFEVTGTVVSSDSAGLSKLTGQKTLFEVMKLVSQPKEILYSYGKKIGGKPIGLWFADNSEMFYEKTIHPKDVVSQMIAAQKEIEKLSVHVGLGVHWGRFWDIGDGLYGDEADFVEGLAEDYTEGGEIAITDAFKQLVEAHFSHTIIPRIDRVFKKAVYRIDYSAVKSASERDEDFYYPVPFDRDFFEFIRTYDDTRSAHANDIKTRFGANKTVILVKVHHKRRQFLLDELTDRVIAKAVMKRLVLSDNIVEIKSNGSLGIFVTNDPSSAIEFTREVKNMMRKNKYQISAGIAAGEVLLFPKEKEIAGGPVNIASKLAEDIGRPGFIYIEESVRLDRKKLLKAKKFRTRISGVILEGNEII